MVPTLENEQLMYLKLPFSTLLLPIIVVPNAGFQFANATNARVYGIGFTNALYEHLHAIGCPRLPVSAQGCYWLPKALLKLPKAHA